MAIAAALLLAQAGASTADEPINCDKALTQLEMNRCAARDFESSDAALNAQWAETAARMKALDAQIDREHDKQPGYFDTLLNGQRAWLTFRDAQCLSESFLARGGSLQPMMNAQCKTYLTELRIQQLRDLVATP
ncbi:MAG: DUF1311 domain-containing protein [Altererythrobacter sp.]|nr:DUF1311 domain-containing protein [Altererythrobacter sp.]